MIIIGVCGGLGNQLQQYALYKKFVSLGVRTKVDLSWFGEEAQADVAAKRAVELDKLSGIEYDICTEEEKKRLVGLNGFEKLIQRFGFGNSKTYSEDVMYDPELLRFTDKYVEGYFTCEYYYADILPVLRKEIRFPVEESRHRDELLRIVGDMRKHYSISIHIRRGDYLDDINKDLYGNICTDHYYSSALNIALKNTDEAKLYVCSDDPEYARIYAPKLVEEFDKLTAYEVIDVNHNSDSLLDIYLMSLCNCNITANSTFSYWGARLNCNENAIRIRPTKHKNSQEFRPDYMLKLWPGWIFVSPEGKVYGI